MSLPDAVKVVADALERDSRELTSVEVAGALMRGYAQQLRIAVTSAQGSKSPFLPPGGVGLEEIIHHEISSGKALRKEVLVEESMGAHMVDVVGGGSDGVMITVDGNMPVGAHTAIGRDIYTLGKDGRLHFTKTLEGK